MNWLELSQIFILRFGDPTLPQTVIKVNSNESKQWTNCAERRWGFLRREDRPQEGEESGEGEGGAAGAQGRLWPQGDVRVVPQGRYMVFPGGAKRTKSVAAE